MRALTGISIFVGLLAMTFIAAALPLQEPCPKQILLGMSYKQIKDGPCPDIEKAARPHIDPFHPAYYCPSLNEMVIGDVRPGNSGIVVSVSTWDGPLP